MRSSPISFCLVSLALMVPRAFAGDGPASFPPDDQDPPMVCSQVPALGEEVDWESFGEVVLAESWEQPALVHFRSPGCASCDNLSGRLDQELSSSGNEFGYFEADVEANPEFIRIFGIKTLPTVVAFYRQMPSGQFIGAIERKSISEWLETLPNEDRSGTFSTER